MEIALVQESEVSERALVARARDGDPQAFGELVTLYMRRAYYVALGLVGSHDDALDLSQEAADGLQSGGQLALRDPEGVMLAVLHVDAHADTFHSLGESTVNHATAFRRTVEEGLQDPARTVQIGLRGTRYEADDIQGSYDMGMRVITMDDFEELGRKGIRANAVCPGPIETALTAARRDEAERYLTDALARCRRADLVGRAQDLRDLGGEPSRRRARRAALKARRRQRPADPDRRRDRARHRHDGASQAAVTGPEAT